MITQHHLRFILYYFKLSHQVIPGRRRECSYCGAAPSSTGVNYASRRITHTSDQIRLFGKSINTKLEWGFHLVSVSYAVPKYSSTARRNHWPERRNALMLLFWWVPEDTIEADATDLFNAYVLILRKECLWLTVVFCTHPTWTRSRSRGIM